MREALTFRERMREEAAKAAAAEAADPWRLTLERVCGKVDFFDRLERISSQTLLDLLEVPQRSRPAGTYRRLAKVMAELGWTAVYGCVIDERRIPGADQRILPPAVCASWSLNSPPGDVLSDLAQAEFDRRHC